jgi:hypothetical protein
LGKIFRASDLKMLLHIFYGHLEYFKNIWDILWPFGTYCAHLVHFFLFWYHTPREIWQPWCGPPPEWLQRCRHLVPDFRST